jgi:hypothetical protein
MRGPGRQTAVQSDRDLRTVQPAASSADHPGMSSEQMFTLASGILNLALAVTTLARERLRKPARKPRRATRSAGKISRKAA